MDSEKKAVKLLIDLNIDGRAYRAGMVEPNPSPTLIAWAKDKTTGTYQNQACQICEFTDVEETSDEDKGSQGDGLSGKSMKELKAIAKEKGITIPFGTSKEKLIELLA